MLNSQFLILIGLELGIRNFPDFLSLNYTTRNSGRLRPTYGLAGRQTTGSV
jgi:hypothetical protein